MLPGLADNRHGTGMSTSDGRFKRNVKENVAGLDFILKLRSVTYTWNLKSLDIYMGLPDSISDRSADSRQVQGKIVHTGFIAQEVEQAAKEIGFDFDGVHIPTGENDPYSLAYAEFVVPLVKAVLEQQQMIEQQNKAIEMLKKEIELLKKQ